MLKLIFAFVAACLGTYLIGAAAATQGALASLPAIAQPIPFGVRAETTFADLVGMAPAYLPLIAGALLPGFIVTALIVRLVPNLRLPGYVLGGAAALLALHLIMPMVVDGIVPVASTRSTNGLLLQGVAGAIGGWLFARISRSRTDAFLHDG